ncbi:helix-turn-helix domain-containing protein [Arthrobacter sp. H14]|uniref:helix-turn-helix domain-containing protein n=1 Tax=Arthrobacter sp. H14 TaxID=1312959 RepID=UPI00047EE96D|nr:helix-turn-helix domain-containing protein [Arthrobacter sp. H14]
MPTKRTPPRYASLTEAADYAHISTRTLRRYITDGRLTGYRVGPRIIRVNLDELDNLFSAIPAASA